MLATSRLSQICPPSIDARYLRHNEESKNISTYNPYSIIMRKIKDAIDARYVSAPEKEITARNERLPDAERMRITRTRNMSEPQSKPDSKRMTARMPATSRIPVSKATWAELSNLKEPGETYDHLLENMIEKEKKRRLFEDMDRVEKNGNFVAMKW